MRHLRVRFFWMALLCSTLFLAGCSKPEEEPAVETAPEDLPPPKPMPGDMVTIPAGEATIGSDTRPSNKQPQPYEPAHKVAFEEYMIDVYEVSNGQFAKFQIESDYQAEGNWRQFYNIGKEDYPVANVTWEDAKAFCAWAGGRLPTEAEWENAARGPEGFVFPWGDKWDPTKSNSNEMGKHNTVEVGEIATDVSPYGVHDMMGNVPEWTADAYKPYPKSPVAGDKNFTRNYIVVRGGSFNIKGSSFSLYTRGAYFPKSQYGIGFRCVKGVGEGKPEPKKIEG